MEHVSNEQDVREDAKRRRERGREWLKSSATGSEFEREAKREVELAMRTIAVCDKAVMFDKLYAKLKHNGIDTEALEPAPEYAHPVINTEERGLQAGEQQIIPGRPGTGAMRKEQ